MIDVDWFAQICALATPNISANDQATLCNQLGEKEEVLPYLIVSAGGFADWPFARAALRGAARTITRPSQSRPGPDSDPAAEHLRRDMRAAIREVLVASDTSKSEEGNGHSNKRAVRLIARYSAKLQGHGCDPHSFIPLD
jgi:hypothetical protein